MRRDRKKGLVWAIAGVFALLGSAAWACTKQATLIGLTPQSATPFTEIIVKGKLETISSSVQIRWNSINGADLASVGAANSDASGNFAVPISVPDVAPGIYSVVVSGPEYGVARAAIEVVAASTNVAPRRGLSPTSDDLWSGLSSGSSFAGSPPVAPEATAASGAVMGVTLLAAGLAGITGAGAMVLRSRRRSSRREA